MSKRSQMLASVLREFIAPRLRDCPQECGMVSLTEIDVSRDFGHATIYLSALEHADTALEFFTKQQKQLQRDLSALHRKKIPQLRFRIDPRTEKGSRIDELLEK